MKTTEMNLEQFQESIRIKAHKGDSLTMGDLVMYIKLYAEFYFKWEDDCEYEAEREGIAIYNHAKCN